MHHPDIPPLINSLLAPGQRQVQAIDKNDYNDIFILTRQTPSEKFTLIRLNFTPPPAMEPGDLQPAPER
jgi:hypothetical protein